MSATAGERIRELYTAFGMDRAAFARRMGFEEALVERVESGQLLPNYCLLGMICEEFGANIDWLNRGGKEMLCKQPYHAIPLRGLRLALTPSNGDDTPLVDELQIARDDNAWDKRSTPAFTGLDEKLQALAGRRMTPADCRELCDLTNNAICEERRLQYGLGMREGMQLMREALSLQGTTPASAYEAIRQAMLEKLNGQGQIVEVGA